LTAKTKDLAGKGGGFGCRVEPIRKGEASIDETWRRQREHYPFSVIRDHTFLQWRFFEHPFHSYEVWGYRSPLRSGFTAYAVFSVEKQRARLIDLLAPPSERTITGFLSRMAAQYARREIDIVEAWLPKEHFLERAFLSMGFTPSQEPLGIIPTGRSFDPRLDYAWASKSIYYTMADGDLI
jgi:hypothetical protein